MSGGGTGIVGQRERSTSDTDADVDIVSTEDARALPRSVSLFSVSSATSSDQSSENEDNISDSGSESGGESYTVEEKLVLETQKVAQCQETITSLIDQITSYQRIMEEVRERESKRIDQLELQLVEERQSKEKMSEQTVNKLQSLLEELASIEQTNKLLNMELETEKKAHSSVLQRMNELQLKPEAAALPIQIDSDQQIKFKFQIKGGRISAVEMVEDDSPREQQLLEERDYLTQKVIGLLQEKEAIVQEKADLEAELQETFDSYEAKEKKVQALLVNVKDAQNKMNKQIEDEKNDNNLMDEAVSLLRAKLGSVADQAIDCLPPLHRSRLLRPPKTEVIQALRTMMSAIDECIPPPAAPPPISPKCYRRVASLRNMQAPSSVPTASQWHELARKISPSQPPQPPSLDPCASPLEYKQYMYSRRLHDDWEVKVYELGRKLMQNCHILGILSPPSFRDQEDKDLQTATPKSTVTCAAPASEAKDLKVRIEEPVGSPSAGILANSRGSQIVQEFLQTVQTTPKAPEPEQKLEQPLEHFNTPGPITCMTICNKFILLGSGRKPGTVKLFNREDHTPTGIEYPVPPVRAMTSLDPFVWVASDDHLLRVFNVIYTPYGQLLSGHKKGPITAILNVNNKTVWSYAADQKICVWSPKTFECLKVINFHTLVSKMVVQGSTVWIGTPQGIYMCDAKTFKISEQRREKTSVSSMVTVKGRLPSTDEIWSSHGNDTIIIWDAHNRTLKGVISACQISDLLCLGLRVWGCSWDKKIKIWDVRTRGCLQEFSNEYSGTMRCLLQVPSKSNCQVWSGSDEGKVCIWDTHSGPHILEMLPVTQQSVCCVCNKPLSSKEALQCKQCLDVILHLKCRDYFATETDLCTPVGQLPPLLLTQSIAKRSSESISPRPTPPTTAPSTSIESATSLESDSGVPSPRNSSQSTSSAHATPPIVLRSPPLTSISPRSLRTSSTSSQSSVSSSGSSCSQSQTSSYSTPSSSEVCSKPLDEETLRLFKMKPLSAIEAVAVKESFPTSPGGIASFLHRHKHQLDPGTVGDLISASDQTDLLQAYIKLVDFSGRDLEMSLRHWLGFFSLPSEGQRIDRLLRAYSSRVHESIEEVQEMFGNSDAVCALAYSIVMLNSALHNANALAKISMSQWVESNSRSNSNQTDFPRDLLEHLYTQIQDAPLEFFNTSESPLMEGMLQKKGKVTSRWMWCTVFSSTNAYLLIHQVAPSSPVYNTDCEHLLQKDVQQQFLAPLNITSDNHHSHGKEPLRMLLMAQSTFLCLQRQIFRQRLLIQCHPASPHLLRTLITSCTNKPGSCRAAPADLNTPNNATSSAPLRTEVHNSTPNLPGQRRRSGRTTATQKTHLRHISPRATPPQAPPLKLR